MSRVHYTENYLINPTNPITVNLIGAGGTGSQVLINLAKINHALIQLDHPGLHVKLWDSDSVSTANLGRQLFAQAEVGQNKAVVLISRTNRFFGTNWKALAKRFTPSMASQTRHSANIFITCVDTVATRTEVADSLKKMTRNRDILRDKPYYWMDFGNSQHTGQVILSTVSTIEQPEKATGQTVAELPFITDEFGELLAASEAGDDTPSCSLADALTKQDLFINATLATMGTSLLWSLFRKGMTENRGFFLNLSGFKTGSLNV